MYINWLHSWFAGGAQDPSAEVLFVSGGRNGDQREGAESTDGTQEGHEGIYREIVPHWWLVIDCLVLRLVACT